MKIVAIVIGCVAVAILVVVIIGYTLPVEHKAVREVELKSSPSKVWSTITAFADAPTWRPELRAVEQVELDGDILWKEIDSHGGSILYQTAETIPQERLVRRIVGDKLPFGGSWTFELVERPTGCALRVTEDGEVYNPVYRFVSRFVFGHTATLDKYLDALKTKLEGTV